MDNYKVEAGSSFSRNGVVNWITTAPWNGQRETIKKVIIVKGVTSIGEVAFSGCDSMTSITIPDSVTSIGEDALQFCSNLNEITIPNSVSSIGSGAFFFCNSLTSITIPDSVTFIGGYVFSSCNSLAEIVVDENNKMYISVDGVLFSKDKQNIICCPAKHSGTHYIIPDGVTTIDAYAFTDCDNLTAITIPDSVTSIWAAAFPNSLQDVYYGGTESDRSNISIGNFNDELTNATWHYNS